MNSRLDHHTWVGIPYGTQGRAKWTCTKCGIDSFNDECPPVNYPIILVETGAHLNCGQYIVYRLHDD